MTAPKQRPNTGPPTRARAPDPGTIVMFFTSSMTHTGSMESADRPIGAIVVAPMRADDVDATVALHQRLLATEMLSRLGAKALRQYHLAYQASPVGLTLVARVGADGPVVGFLLGSVDASTHYQFLVSERAMSFARSVVAHAVTHPMVGWELVRTRAVRWTTGAVRAITAARSRPGSRRRQGGSGRFEGAATPTGAPTAEVTHLAVDVTARRKGVGRELLGAAVDRARSRGAGRIELVTPAEDQDAARFYRSCGWISDGEVRSRSGEDFARFTVRLIPTEGGPGPAMPADLPEER